MCGMVTLITGVVSTALAVASSVQSGKAAQEQSEYQAAMAANEVEVRKAEAKKIREDAAEQETFLRKEQAVELGSQRSLLAAQGYDLSDMDGSAATYLVQKGGQNEDDALRFRQEGEYQAWQQENAVYEAQARAQQTLANTGRAETSSLLNFGKSSISAGKSVASAWYYYG